MGADGPKKPCSWPGCKELLEIGVVFISETAARREEAIRLERPDLNMRDRVVRIGSDSKGRRVRYVPLSDRCIEALQRIPPRIDCTRVFINQRTRRPWTTIEKAWNNARTELNLPQMDRHCLRHYRITEWLRHGVEPYQVQYLAGHRDISTTMIYVHIVQKHLGDAVRKAQAAEAKEKKA